MERRLPLLMLLGVLALFVSLLAAPGVASALPTASGALEPGSRQSGMPEAIGDPERITAI
jgi:hypothetical protein